VVSNQKLLCDILLDESEEERPAIAPVSLLRGDVVLVCARPMSIQETLTALGDPLPFKDVQLVRREGQDVSTLYGLEDAGVFNAGARCRRGLSPAAWGARQVSMPSFAGDPGWVPVEEVTCPRPGRGTGRCSVCTNEGV